MIQTPSSLPLNSGSSQAACPVCRSPKVVPYASGRDRLFGLAAGEFPLYKCFACGCLFLHPLPSGADLAKFYPQEYWWSEKSMQGSRAARILGRLEKAYREFVTADHARFVSQCAVNAGGKLLLDIGCGNGTFLHLARKHGFIPHGMDASQRAVDIAREQYGIEVRRGEIGSGAWDGSKFDFITMFHVLEHLPDPRAGLQFARGLLEPNGMLIIQVPDASSLQARLFRSRWYGLDVPRHVINYTPKALSRLLADAGFEFHLVSRFSLRDNPASIASSLLPSIDPIGRKGRSAGASPLLNAAAESAYFGLFLLSLIPAYVESLCGMGGTIWVKAKSRSL